MTAQPRIAPQIFRAYDIRGIVGAGLDESSIELIGRVIGSEALDQGERALLTAADARLSSPALSRALLRGILSTGCDVCDLGVVPTPLLYFGAEVLPIHSGVMLTGSHNPKEYNGIKIVLRQRALADGQIRQLQQRIEQDNFHHGAGAFTRHDINAAYIERIVSDIQFQKRWRVVLDAGNGVTGLVAPQLFTQLGCEVIPLYCELDGNFPHHHPDPSRADCLQDLRAAVLRHGADLGLAFDGDGDRIGLVSAQGDIIDTDHLLFAFVSDLLPRYPGARVVYDIKSS
ncbi:MAG: phosphomannomutase/phosphoglucomutase, partial [Pseudomonadales bacterium]|nr:phosphomannomutase/phosphoglucomutase [Pseudomonadales bacterium]